MKQNPQCTISEFIQNFKRGHDAVEIQRIFTCGNCYHFALILSQLYQGGDIVYSNLVGHFAYQYLNHYYDITGEINMSDAKIFCIHDSNTETQELIRDCVYRINYYPHGKCDETKQ